MSFAGAYDGVAKPSALSSVRMFVHVAFGATQERYCFCSDECYGAFREMFPARVHRNCYERNCHDCSYCIKRYGDEAEGVRMLAKDYLTVRQKK